MLRNELHLVTAQLESARSELKQQGHATELAHQESSSSHQQHVLQHRDETRRLNEQVRSWGPSPGPVCPMLCIGTTADPSAVLLNEQVHTSWS